MAPEHQVKVTSACKSAAVCGFVAPFGTITEVHQLLSVNGWPTHESILHDFILRVHAGVRSGQRRRPNTFVDTVQPAYAMHVTVPDDWVTFSGSTLSRAVVFVQAAVLEGLVAKALHSVWRQHMPAPLLGIIEGKIGMINETPWKSRNSASQEQSLKERQGASKLSTDNAVLRSHQGALLQQVSGHAKRGSHKDVQPADCGVQQVLCFLPFTRLTK